MDIFEVTKAGEDRIRGMILYEGPSQIDGSPIVVIATMGSKNRKTGDMIQTWIMRADMDPLAASKMKVDDAVCGDCPHRVSLGGACYVAIYNAPLTVYRAWKRGNYTDSKYMAKMTREMQGTPIRIGSYGDPAAVPLWVWHKVVGMSGVGWTGYTHQWAQSFARGYEGLLMASVDSAEEESRAHAMGWRTFRVIASKEEVPTARTFECVADSREINCVDCKACDGAKPRNDNRPQAASVWIGVHGPLVKRFTAKSLPVLSA